MSTELFAYAILLSLHAILTVALAWMARRSFGQRWVNALIASNGLISGLGLLAIAMAASFRILLPLRVEPAAAISFVIGIWNGFSEDASGASARKPDSFGSGAPPTDTN